MFSALATLGVLLVVTVVKGDMWTLPTAENVQTTLERCEIMSLSFLNASGNQQNDSDLRCFAKELGLWSDSAGFEAKRFVKLLHKQRQAIEISVVVSYCNSVHRQADLNKWANESFKCFAYGRMGPWIMEYLKNIYKNKTLRN